MEKKVKVWYDREGDYLEVLFETKEGYFRETEDDAVMEKVDTDGNMIGFSILKVSKLSEEKTLSVSLKNRAASDRDPDQVLQPSLRGVHNYGRTRLSIIPLPPPPEPHLLVSFPFARSQAPAWERKAEAPASRFS